VNSCSRNGINRLPKSRRSIAREVNTIWGLFAFVKFSRSFPIFSPN
jgi:hypothetical protein